MRLFTKGGVPPCDRRLDRRKVAIAAIAALFMFAPSASKAAIVDFEISPTLSFFKHVSVWDVSKLALGDGAPYGTVLLTSVPQDLDVDDAGPKTYGSDTAFVSGNLLIDLDLVGNLINFPGGSTINYEVTGSYVPFDPIYTDPPHPTGVDGKMGPPGSYGTKITIGAPYGTISTNQHSLISDLLNIGAPAIAMTPGVVQTFPLAFTPGPNTGAAILYKEGRLALANSGGLLGVEDSGDLIGDPEGLFGTGAPDSGTFDNSTLTLTLPMTSSLPLPVNIDTDPVIEVIIYALTTGVIVATPKVPEPSTLMLLGFGVVGLLTCAWRSRKRLTS